MFTLQDWLYFAFLGSFWHAEIRHWKNLGHKEIQAKVDCKIFAAQHFEFYQLRLVDDSDLELLLHWRDSVSPNRTWIEQNQILGLIIFKCNQKVVWYPNTRESEILSLSLSLSVSLSLCVCVRVYVSIVVVMSNPVSDQMPGWFWF